MGCGASPTMTEALEAMLGAPRGFTIAAAGCGKTQLLGQLAAHEKSGRQLVLTHTHAGIAALKKRLDDMGVPSDKFHLDTIAGWCLRYGAAYPSISGVASDAEGRPNWPAVYPGALRVVRSALGQQVLVSSYDGVIVDEYQDCSNAQHAVLQAIAEVLPCRGVGDPLQSVFNFRDEPAVSLATIRRDFQVLAPLLHPWRWERSGHNRELGHWLAWARGQLERYGRINVERHAPVQWLPYDGEDTWAAACRDAGAPSESTIAILQWPNQCIQLAQRLGGRWPVVERFDDPDLFACAATLARGDGPAAVVALFEFLAPRMTHMGTELRRVVDAVAESRSTARFTTYLDHLGRLRRLADEPSRGTVLAALDGILGHRGWWLYRRDCVYQLRAALQECIGVGLDALPDAVTVARTQARHRGRRTHRRTIGTPLLVKGLEFDHAVVLWEPQHMSMEGLYVAITRASKSLTIVSNTRDLVPQQ